LLAVQAREEKKEEERVSRPRIEYQVEVARLLLFNGEVSQIADFVIACKL